MPSGGKLGIMAFDVTPTAAAQCWVCKDKGLDKKVCSLGKHKHRLWYRQKPGQAEKSLHVACVLNSSFMSAKSHTVTSAHLNHSIAFLTRNKEEHTFAASLREDMTQLLDKLVPLAEGHKESG